MRVFLSRHWFVCALPAVLALAAVAPQLGAKGGWLRSEYTAWLGIAALFWTQGLGLSLEAIHHGLRQWRLNLLIQGFSFVGFPLLGLACDLLFGRMLPSDLRLGFLFLSVLPSTLSTASALTAVAGGNTAAAIFNAVASNLAGVVVTPIWIFWLMQSSGQAPRLSPVAVELLTVVILPLLAGQVARGWLRNWAEANKSRLSVGNSLIVLFIILTAASDSVVAGFLHSHGVTTLIYALAGSALLLFAAAAIVDVAAQGLGIAWTGRITACICAPQKSLASGLPLAKIVFGDHPGFAVIILPLLLYHPLQILVFGLAAGRWSRRNSHLPRPR
jgi:sodium/bile acid cotransporter 7